MAKEPLRDYRNQLLNYGIGRAFAEGRPVTRGMMAEAELPDDPSSLIDNLKRIKMAGGLSGMDSPVKSNASEIEKLITPPKSIKEATSQIIKKGTPSDFVPFKVPKEGEPGVGRVIRGKSTKPGTKVFTDAITEAKSVPGSEMPDPMNERGRGNIYDSLAARREKAKEKAAPVDEANEKLFTQAMADFIKEARGTKAPGDTEVKSLDEYKKEFADATGIEIEKVDKSSALMALGLGLMQNRAGKGFNLGRILNAVGEAGVPALAELKEARAETRANAAAAGKYALDMRSADQEKAKAAALAAQQRGKYYIMPKSEGQSGFISVMDEAVPEFLNSTELNALVTNPDFSAEYDVITEERFNSIVDKVLEPTESPDTFTDKTSKIVLFGGSNVDDIFTFEVNNVNPNLPDNLRPQFGKLSNPGVAGQIYDALGNALTDLNKFEDTFAGAIAAIDEDAATFGSQIQNTLIQVVDTLGFNVDANTDTAELDKFLTKLQAQQAATILGEAGKTLSDKDRELVKEIVGALPGLLNGGSPDVLREKLLQLKTQLIDNKRREIYSAFRTMDNYSRQDTSEVWNTSEWTEEKEQELINLRKRQGAEKDG